RSADLKVTKTAPASAFAGTDVSFSIKVENLGPSNNVGFTVEDVLPSGTTFVSASSGCLDSSPLSGTVTCTAASLGAGGSVTWTITVHISSFFAPGNLTNVASIKTNTTPDPVSANDSDDAV